MATVKPKRYITLEINDDLKIKQPARVLRHHRATYELAADKLNELLGYVAFVVRQETD